MILVKYTEKSYVVYDTSKDKHSDILKSLGFWWIPLKNLEGVKRGWMIGVTRFEKIKDRLFDEIPDLNSSKIKSSPSKKKSSEKKKISEKKKSSEKKKFICDKEKFEEMKSNIEEVQNSQKYE